MIKLHIRMYMTNNQLAAICVSTQIYDNKITKGSAERDKSTLFQAR